jgi:hypothetical protein
VGRRRTNLHTTKETILLLAEVLEFCKSALDVLGQSWGWKALLIPKVLHNIITTMMANFEEELEQKHVHLMNRETQQVIQTKVNRRMEGQDDDPSSVAAKVRALHKKVRYVGNLVPRAIGGFASARVAKPHLALLQCHLCCECANCPHRREGQEAAPATDEPPDTWPAPSLQATVAGIAWAADRLTNAAGAAST